MGWYRSGAIFILWGKCTRSNPEQINLWTVFSTVCLKSVSNQDHSDEVFLSGILHLGQVTAQHFNPFAVCTAWSKRTKWTKLFLFLHRIMEGEILSWSRLLPFSKKLYLREWITTRRDMAKKMSCGEMCVMKWWELTNIGDVIACNNYSHEAFPYIISKQIFFIWELEFVSEPIIQTLKPG